MHVVHLLWDVHEIALRGNQLWIQECAVVFVYIRPGCWWPFGKTNSEKIRKGTFSTTVLFVAHLHWGSLGPSGWQCCWNTWTKQLFARHLKTKKEIVIFSLMRGHNWLANPLRDPWFLTPTSLCSTMEAAYRSELSACPNNCQNKTRQSRFASRSFPTPYLLKLLVTSEGDLVLAQMGRTLRLNPQRRGD